MPPQMVSFSLNKIIEPDYENIRTIIKNAKRNALLTEFLQDIREREDYLERHSSQSRKLYKIRSTCETKKYPEKMKDPQKSHNLNAV